MLTRINVVFTLLIIFASFTIHAQDLHKLFEQANIEMEKGNLKESLSLLQNVQSIHPDLPNVLWNIGTIALMLEDYGLANQTWIKMREIEPDEWSVLGKLAQSSIGLANIDAFDQYRSELVALHKKGEDSDLAKQERFLIEQIPMPKGRIYIYQYFSPLSEELPIFYQAVLVDEDSSIVVRTSLGSYNSTNEINKELGLGTDDERLYHFDLYENDGSHRTLGMSSSESTIKYENAAPVLVNAIKDWITVN